MEQTKKQLPRRLRSLREALVTLTNANQGAKRDEERKKWGPEKWNAWWENIQKREKIRIELVAKLEEADKLGAADKDRKTYPKLSKMTNEAFDQIETCIKMCEPNDPEDVVGFEAIQKRYGANKYQFEKFQVLDESHRK